VAAPARARPGRAGPSAVDEEITQRQGQRRQGGQDVGGQLAGGEREEQDAPTAAQQHEAEARARPPAPPLRPPRQESAGRGRRAAWRGTRRSRQKRPVEPHARARACPAPGNRRRLCSQKKYEANSGNRTHSATYHGAATTLTMAAKPATARQLGLVPRPLRPRIQPTAAAPGAARPPAPWSARPARTLRPRAPTNRGVTFRRESPRKR